MLGDALRCIRVFHDLNQSTAAKRLGISRSYLSEIESGDKEPTLQLIQRYAAIFQLPASSILFFSENLTQPQEHGLARRVVAGKVLALMRFLAARSGGNADAG
jgi:transcriptional regulator with XRE-family HTH domain